MLSFFVFKVTERNEIDFKSFLEPKLFAHQLVKFRIALTLVIPIPYFSYYNVLRPPTLYIKTFIK